MLKQTLVFTDSFGEEHTEDHYFNLSRAEIIEREMNEFNGEFEDMQAKIDRISSDKVGKDVLYEFKAIIVKSYGVRDGKFFRKSPEAFKNFEESGAYDELFMRLVTDAVFATDFIKGILPVNLKAPINGAPTNSSDAARQASEAQMQGYKPAQVADPVTVTEPLKQSFAETVNQNQNES